MTPQTTLCIPSIPTRSALLTARAIPSVLAQTLPAAALAIYLDNGRVGAWESRNRTIDMATTDWIAFLDDDDELLPDHLATLHAAASDAQADVVWGWFEVIGGTDPFPSHRGQQWNPDNPRIFPITTLIRRELVQDAGARFAPDPAGTGNWSTQDYPFWRTLDAAGGTFLAIPDITWRWHHHGANTSGVPSRW